MVNGVPYRHVHQDLSDNFVCVDWFFDVIVYVCVLFAFFPQMLIL